MRRKLVFPIFVLLAWAAFLLQVQLRQVASQSAGKPRLGTGEISGVLEDGYDKAVTYGPRGNVTGITVKLGQMYQCYFFTTPATTITGGELRKGWRVKVAYKKLVSSEQDVGYFFTGDAVAITVIDAGKQQNSATRSGSILFSSRRDGNQEVYALDLATRKEVNLTNNAADDGYPRMSPDGRRSAFVSNRAGYWATYLMNPDGSRPVKLLKDRIENGYPAWSSDSWLLLFAATKAGERKNDIYVSGADGSTLRRLTSHPAEDVHPARSPNGDKIAFASERDGNRRIYMMNGDGSGLVCLTNDRWYSDYSAWSPDGLRIAFASDRDSRNSNRLDIYVMNADGTNIRRITNHSADDRHPCWSPDGKMLAFASDRLGDRDIFTVNADGSAPSVLVRSVGEDEHPQWNSTIAVFAERVTTKSEIRQVDFKNFTYQLTGPSSDTQIEPIRLRNGKYSKGQLGSNCLNCELYKVAYGDLTGDGNEEAAVVLLYNFCGSAFWMNGQIYILKDGRPSLLTRFEAGGRGHNIQTVAIRDGLLVADYDVSEGEAASIKYRWNGRSLIEVWCQDTLSKVASSLNFVNGNKHASKLQSCCNRLNIALTKLNSQRSRRREATRRKSVFAP